MPNAILPRLALAATLLAGAALLPQEAGAQEVQSRACRVDQVGVFTNRVHIKCAPEPGQAFTSDIRFYAMATSQDARVVDNVVALALAAKQTNRPMVIWFDWADYRSVPGCQGQDCRKLVGAALE